MPSEKKEYSAEKKIFFKETVAENNKFGVRQNVLHLYNGTLSTIRRTNY